MQISDEQKNDVVRVASWRRRDYDLMAIRSPPRENALVMPYLAEPFQSPPESSLGSLHDLPAEVISMICRGLDVLSLFRFRQVNRHARVAVSNLLEYKAMANNALDCLRAVLRTGLARRPTFRVLYLSMCSMECAQCGFFGGYLFLPTLERCCYTCLQESPNLEVVTLSTFSKASGLSQKRLGSLIPIVHTIPGIYTIWEKKFGKRIKITAKDVAIQSLKEQNLGRDLTNHEFRLSSRQEMLRHMAAVRIPFLDNSTNNPQPTFCCKGCQMILERPGSSHAAGVLRDREYLKDGFLDHFQSCTEAQSLWTSNSSDTKTIEEPPLFEKGGFVRPLDSSGNER
ncbi:hypothetical protein B0I35DRAFT_441670 [Stachybotrys elegans]|uniref:F-box domain-containing protein n=1 Tax=Stachybotrys elegans TaxID=80388 RepID=A0A8K0WLJ8_9HYPO|nr:hypothetical protein B0I35DRAFT_441670 [Stachybotrys elegans]